MTEFLSHLRNIVMGAIAGVFVIGIPMSWIWEPNLRVGVGSALIGVGLYYIYLTWKGR